MTLTEFLLARIAEDEEDARVLVNEGALSGFHASDFSGPARDEEYSALNIGAGRVLAECKAKRQIVERYAALKPIPVDLAEGIRGGLEYAVKVLALPYAGHPDYDEAWRP